MLRKYERPPALEGETVKFRMSCGSVYATFNTDPESGKLVEIFMRVGKAGGCQGALLQALSRALSIALQEGSGIESLAKTLVGIQCPGCQPGESSERLRSCLDAVARHMLERYKEGG